MRNLTEEWEADEADTSSISARHRTRISESNVTDPFTMEDGLTAVLDYMQYPERIRELRALPYSEYLLSDHWRGVRRIALQRVRYRCERCQSYDRTTLQVHHLSYEHLGVEEPNELEVLCAKCHRSEHGIEASA